MSTSSHGSEADHLARLNALLEEWVEEDKRLFPAHHYPGEMQRQCQESWERKANHMANMARPLLHHFLRDNSDKTAEQLEELAAHLSPGGAHTGGRLAYLIYKKGLAVDALLLAALMRWNWGGGKMGFQFLPDPADADEDIEEYWFEAEDLIKFFQTATDGDPRRILTGNDRAFYEWLPEKFTVYRGCSGISFDIAWGGLCWTTKREVAEWFAWRGAPRRKPLVVTATKVSKCQIAFVKASEYEIVVQPTRAREIKYRKHPEGWRPEMKWTLPA